METWKKTVIGVALALAAAYLLASLVLLTPRRLQGVCQQLVIQLTDSTKKQFVSPYEMRQFILRSGLNPEGKNISLQQCQQIKKIVLQHPMIRKASVYPSPSGNIIVRLTQRQPKLRVLGAENYYIDSDRKVMPIKSSTATDVPVITGHVSQRMAQEELFDFIQWLEDDEFWTAQIEQIHIVSPNRIELVPRVGSGVIIIGSLRDYDKKLRKLSILYQKGFAKFGWKEYREIDLRFKNQIVCR